MNEDLKTTLKPAFDLLTESAIKYYKKHQYYGMHLDTKLDPYPKSREQI